MEVVRASVLKEPFRHALTGLEILRFEKKLAVPHTVGGSDVASLPPEIARLLEAGIDAGGSLCEQVPEPFATRSLEANALVQVRDGVARCSTTSITAALEPAPRPFNDGFRRLVVSKTIYLRNARPAS